MIPLMHLSDKCFLMCLPACSTLLCQQDYSRRRISRDIQHSGHILSFLVVAVHSTISSDAASAGGHRFFLLFRILWNLLALSLDHIENNWWNVLHVSAKHILRRKCRAHCGHFSTAKCVSALDWS